MDNNINGIWVNKYGYPDAGYEGGLKVTRDTTTAVGGTPGHVSVGSYFYTIAGKDVKNFEWNALFLLDNYATSGENCAMYAQANAKSTGPAWASCFEVCEESVPSKNAPMRAIEVDVGASGPDNGQRYGMHLVVSDGPYGRKGIQTNAQATYAIYSGASGSTPWARWMYGAVLKDFNNAGVYLYSNSSIRGIHLEGNYVVSLDLSGAQDATTIRMKAGQRICFDGYDDISLSWEQGRLRLKNRNTPIFEIDTSNGNIYKNGIKVL